MSEFVRVFVVCAEDVEGTMYDSVWSLRELADE